MEEAHKSYSSLKDLILLAKKRETLSCLSLVTQMSLMETFLDREVTFSKLVTSPFRKDSNPGCSFYASSTGNLLFKDWAVDKSYDLVDVIMKAASISLEQALNIMSKHIDTTHTKKIVKEKRNKTVELLPKAYDINVVEYWKSQGVSISTLSEYGVINCARVYVNTKLTQRATTTNPIYAYPMFPKGIKLYRPLGSKDQKHFNYADKEAVFGYLNLPRSAKNLIITKSPKDVMALHDLGFYAISPLNEGNLIPSHLMESLKTRFQNIFTLMDFDPAGKRSATKYENTYTVTSLFFDKEYEKKDVSDNINAYGAKKTKKWLRKKVAQACAQQK